MGIPPLTKPTRLQWSTCSNRSGPSTRWWPTSEATECFKHYDTLTETDYQYGFERKFLAQVRLVQLGQPTANDGASFTLSSGYLSDYPNPASAATGPFNAAVDAYVRSVAPLLSRGLRLNVVSPAPIVGDGDESRGTITAAQAAASYVEAIHSDFTGRVLRPWGGLLRV